jgi:hypothetical protein
MYIRTPNYEVYMDDNLRNVKIFDYKKRSEEIAECLNREERCKRK